MLTLIIGKHSNLSSALVKKIPNVKLIPSQNVTEALDLCLLQSEAKINLIFNNFQAATQLNNFTNPLDYIQRSIATTALVLTYMLKNNIAINKIIYTSSSSVYGNNMFCNEDDQVQPFNLHAALKVSNEKLIEQFSKNNNIDYTIARVFNMYGGNDSFSIISKIIKAYSEDEELTFVNNGSGIRDFIHIDDIVSIYSILLSKRNIPYINIGTGRGISIKNIVDYLKYNNVHLKFKSILRDELKVSIANNQKLLELLGTYKFQQVEEFILKEILL